MNRGSAGHILKLGEEAATEKEKREAADSFVDYTNSPLTHFTVGVLKIGLEVPPISLFLSFRFV